MVLMIYRVHTKFYLLDFAQNLKLTDFRPLMGILLSKLFQGFTNMVKNMFPSPTGDSSI